MIFDDPHYQERGLMELVDHPSTGPQFMPGISWKMSKTPGGVRWPTPRLGEHNETIFGELLGSRRRRADRAGGRGRNRQGAHPRQLALNVVL